MNIKKLLAVIIILTILGVGAFFGYKYLWPTKVATNITLFNNVSDYLDSNENATLDLYLQSSESDYNTAMGDSKNNFVNAKNILDYIQGVGTTLNSFCLVSDSLTEIEYVTVKQYIDDCETLRGALIRELVQFKAVIQDGPTGLANTYNRTFEKIANYIVKSTTLVSKINEVSEKYYYTNSLSMMNSLYEMYMIALENTYTLTNYQINSVAYGSFDAIQLDFNISNGYILFDDSILQIGGMTSEPVQKFIEKYETIDKTTFVMNYQTLKTTTPNALADCESDFEIAMFYLKQISGGV